jgi:hypothetical protein
MTGFKFKKKQRHDATCDNSQFMGCLTTYVKSFGVTTMPSTFDEFLQIYADYLQKYGAGGYENSCKLVFSKIIIIIVLLFFRFWATFTTCMGPNNMHACFNVQYLQSVRNNNNNKHNIL